MYRKAVVCLCTVTVQLPHILSPLWAKTFTFFLQIPLTSPTLPLSREAPPVIAVVHRVQDQEHLSTWNMLRASAPTHWELVPKTAFEDWMFDEEKARMIWRNKRELSSAPFGSRFWSTNQAEIRFTSGIQAVLYCLLGTLPGEIFINTRSGTFRC